MSSQRSADQTSIAALCSLVSAAPARLGLTRLVLVDGPAGSGKTVLANRLGAALGCGVVHGDDMYEGWMGLSVLWETLGERVLEPLVRGEAARFRRWDWGRGERGDWIEVPAAHVLVIEGVGVAGRRARPYASLVIYVEAPWELRHARGFARDGEAMRDDWLRWEAAEAPILRTEGTREAADVVVDGARAILD